MINKVLFFLYLIFASHRIEAQIRDNKVLNNLGANIQFTYKDTILEKGSINKIKEVAKLLNKSNKLFFLDSHTCVEGSEKDNFELTQKRALIVARKLLELGVDSFKIIPRGRGEMYPVYLVVSSRLNFKNRIIQFTTRRK
ncbi:OmpA family protein [uncultured Tenacibaculum sp.]|uniref:OmpA family protein n=1 Tax=uncultured Tenacibaculum sp. TaxID=174713 RepID=UPI00260E3D10|nr:OmpA family protein [uncultured Tenacibaculum sp.]